MAAFANSRAFWKVNLTTLCTTEREGSGLANQVAKQLGMTFLSVGLDVLPTVQARLDDTAADQYNRSIHQRYQTLEAKVELVRRIATKLKSNPLYPSAWDILVADKMLAISLPFACLSLKWDIPYVIVTCSL